MVRKQQIWGEERQTQNEGKYSEVLRDRMLTGIAVVARRAHVLPHLGRVGQYLSQLSHFFKIRARKALFFLSCSLVHFFFSGSSVVCCLFFNYLDLAFPIPHLVTV